MTPRSSPELPKSQQRIFLSVPPFDRGELVKTGKRAGKENIGRELEALSRRHEWKRIENGRRADDVPGVSAQSTLDRFGLTPTLFKPCIDPFAFSDAIFESEKVWKHTVQRERFP